LTLSIPQYADVAVIVQNDRNDVIPRILSKLPTAQVTPRSGRHGWSDAVFDYVEADLKVGPYRNGSP